MAWLQVRLTTDAEQAPLIEAALTNAGALAVTLGDAGDDPQLEPAPGTQPLWGHLCITALFPDGPGALEQAAALGARLAGALAAQPVVEYLPERAWERAWLDDFRPTRFGERLWVCPRGQAPADAQALIVELDPGLAFGTGHHATTALCLEWLDAAQLGGCTLIDYGCGSGILAIAALRLGAAQATAVDHDPQALEATRDNALANGVANRLRICAPAEPPLGAADVLVANILAATLVELAPRLAELVRPGGRIALSGLLADQVAAVSAAYETTFALDPPREREDWVLLSGRRLATD